MDLWNFLVRLVMMGPLGILGPVLLILAGLWASRGDLRDTYAVPNAFQSFRGTVLDRLGHF